MAPANDTAYKSDVKARFEKLEARLTAVEDFLTFVHQRQPDLVSQFHLTRKK